MCDEFKLEYVYSGVNFCGENVYGNFFGRNLILADRWKNRKKFEPAKMSCHTVSLVYLNFVCFVDSMSLFLQRTIKKNRPVRRRKTSAHLKFLLRAIPLSLVRAA